ncbi:hypothetical protein Esti_003662 [Eimeria stiedai]
MSLVKQGTGKLRKVNMEDDQPGGLSVEQESVEESIRVCTRMRPLFPKEVESGHIMAWKVEHKSMQLIVEPPTQTELEEHRQGKAVKKVVEKTQAQKEQVQRYFTFDRCFDDDAENDEVFGYVARDIVLDAFKGINGCVFAYGQTGSGKTHSIMGVAEDPGILPRSLAEFFDCMSDSSLLRDEMADAAAEKEEENGSTLSGSNNRAEGLEEGENREYLMRVSYVEIYLERVNDLLQEGPKGGAVENLDVKEDPKRGFVVIGLHEEAVASMEEAMSLLSKAEQRRHFARTNFNETSSRSHVVFSITLESTSTFEDGTNVSRRGELKIVDLAGNEKAGRASEGVENAKLVLEEGKAINKSLFLLSEVISKLSKQAQQGDDKKGKKGEKDMYIPWRDSKLTRLLQKALGGNSRAAVLVAVHPSSLYLDTSFSTLRFAMKCKEIKKKVCANFFSPEQSLIAQQKKLIAMLHAQLKELSEGGLASGISQHQKPEDDEQIRILKDDLENKVAKFQQFIIKATATQAPSVPGGGELARARTMRQPSAFRRMETLAAARYGLRDIDGLNQADAEDPAVRASMTHALSLLDRFGQDVKHENYGSLRSCSSGDSGGEVLRFETLEHSIEGALQELECIDANPPSPADDSPSCGESSVSDSSDREVSAELEPEEDTPVVMVTVPDAAVGERKLKRLKSSGGAKARQLRQKGEKKAKPKTSKITKKARFVLPKQSSESALEDLPTPAAPEEPAEADKESEGTARKLKALVTKHKTERESWAAKLRRAKEMGLEVVSKVLYRMQDEKEALVKAKKRSAELSNQIRHIYALMHRLGLSVLSTASTPAKGSDASLQPRDKEKESLKAFLDRVKEMRDAEPLNLASGIGDPVGQTARAQSFPDIDQIRPLAYAAISSALSRVMLSEVLESTQDGEDGGELKSSATLHPPIMALAASVAGSRAFNATDEAPIPKTFSTEQEAVSALDLIFSKGNPADSKKATVDKETAKMVERKKEHTVESILHILPPWEHHMLALLYEQQEMRRALGQLRDHFVQRLREIQISVKRGMLEKLELSEHCDRMLAALWSFKAELTDSKSPNRVDDDTNAKFGKLMAKLEELSIRLVERDIDYRLLSEDYLTVKDENATLTETIRKLKDENRSLLMIPRTMAHWDEFKGYEDDVEKKALARDVHLLQGYVSYLRTNLEEGRAVELDVRRLNQALYQELLAANTTIGDLQDQIKFHTSVDRREAKLMEDQLIAANQAELEKSERIRELEQQVADLQEQLAAATAKPEEGEGEGELPVEPVDVTTESELAPPKRALKRGSVSAKSKAKARSGRALSVHSPSFTLSPARQKQPGKRLSVMSTQPTVDRGSSRPANRLPTRANTAALKAEKPNPARTVGSRLVTLVEPDERSSAAPSSRSPPPSQKHVSGQSESNEDSATSGATGEPQTGSKANTLSPGTPSKALGRAPAFTGDPRNKGLANMTGTLSRRRKSGAA